jgi:hypothetical protein
MSEKFDIYSKIFFRDVGHFFRHLCELVLRHQMRVSNYFVNSFYSVSSLHIIAPDLDVKDHTAMDEEDLGFLEDLGGTVSRD